MIKKEFISYWCAEQVGADVHKMPIPKVLFFNEVKGHIGRSLEIVMPENVRFDDLAVFIGRKTKITIEVVE